jgi:hypothetical protein
MIKHVQNENFILDSTRIFLKTFYFACLRWKLYFPRIYPNFWPNSSSDDRFKIDVLLYEFSIQFSFFFFKKKIINHFFNIFF